MQVLQYILEIFEFQKKNELLNSTQVFRGEIGKCYLLFNLQNLKTYHDISYQLKRVFVGFAVNF